MKNLRVSVMILAAVLGLAAVAAPVAAQDYQSVVRL